MVFGDVEGSLKSERILVLGASGWFGLTLLDHLSDHPSDSVMTVASRSRKIVMAQRVWDISEWNWPDISDWSPTVVLNFAFLTRDRLKDVPLHRFTRTNREMTRRFLAAAAIPSVKVALTVSSGVASIPPTATGASADPYARLKREEELRTLELSSMGRTAVVLRAFSVSGPWVRRPSEYAFSDLVLQAKSGVVHLRADRPVYRRYVSVSDLLAVGLARAMAGASGLIESGGELVEVGYLARRIIERVNPRALLLQAPHTTAIPDVYASDDLSWQRACEEAQYLPCGLGEQIDAVSRHLLSKLGS